MPTATQIQTVLKLPAGSFINFGNQLASLHNSPHVRIGGQMALVDSRKAPEFFLHHAMVDQIFDAWQRKSAAHLNAYYDSFPVNVTMPFSGNSTSFQVNDLTKQGKCGDICVKYT